MSWLTKLLPWIKTLFDRLSSSSERRAVLEAEVDLIEAQAFAQGRISPKYLFQYAVVAAFVMLLLWMLAHAIAPAYIGSPYAAIDRVFEIVVKTVNSVFGVL